MNLKTNFFALGLLIFNGIQMGQAQTHDTTIHELPMVQVSALRTEQLLNNTTDIVKVVNKSEIDKLKFNSIGEIIEYSSGLNVERGTGSGFNKRSVISMNGMAPNYTLVLVNGTRLLSDHVHSGQNIDLIPVEEIERVEIIKTSASSQYGTDAFGGVVNIITKRSDDENSGSIYADISSYNTHHAGAGISTKINDNIGFYSLADYETSDGTPLKDKDSHRYGHTGYKTLNLTERISANFKKFSADAMVKYVNNEMAWFRDENDAAKSHLFMPSLNLSYEMNKNLRLNSKVSYTEWMAEVSSEKNRLTHPELWLNIDLSEHNTILVGSDYRYNKFTRSSVETNDQHAWGVFIQDEHNFGSKFSIMGALRFDQTMDYDPVIIPKLSLLYKPLNFIRLRASYSGGYHAPAVQELYEYASGHGGTALRFGNTELKPEKNHTINVSVDTDVFDDFHLFASGNYSMLTNMIVPVYEGQWVEDSTFNVWRRQNILEADILNLEAGMRYLLMNSLILEASYTYTENRSDLEHQKLPYNAGKSFSAKINWKNSLTDDVKIDVFAGIKMLEDRSIWSWKPGSDMVEDDASGLIIELEDFQKLDAGLSVDFKDTYKFYFNVFNILGQDYVNLDDYYYMIDGEPVWKVGFKYNF
jgi:outer membrane cobalamin receptor